MFSDLLRRLRQRRGISQTDLAKAIGVSNGNVGDWERGRSKPGYDALISLSRFFEVSAGYLLELPSETSLSCDGKTLSESEMDLIAMYRYLDKADKETIFDLVTLKYDKATGKKGSVYSTYTDTKEPQDGAAQNIHNTGSGIA